MPARCSMGTSPWPAGQPVPWFSSGCSDNSNLIVDRSERRWRPTGREGWDGMGLLAVIPPPEHRLSRDQLILTCEDDTFCWQNSLSTRRRFQSPPNRWSWNLYPQSWKWAATTCSVPPGLFSAGCSGARQVRTFISPKLETAGKQTKTTVASPRSSFAIKKKQNKTKPFLFVCYAINFDSN